jgi:hypothetical protein
MASAMKMNVYLTSNERNGEKSLSIHNWHHGLVTFVYMCIIIIISHSLSGDASHPIKIAVNEHLIP